MRSIKNKIKMFRRNFTKKTQFVLLAAAFSFMIAGCSQREIHSAPSSQIEAETQQSSSSEEDAGEQVEPGIPEESESHAASSPPPSISSELVQEAPEPSASETLPVRPDGVQPISPADYQKLLGRGMDVDWSKTNQGRKYYNTQAAVDFAQAGVSHVRIRVADKATDDLLESLDQQIEDCLANGIILVIAYQADEFKNDPTEKNIQKVVDWWTTVADHYKDTSYLLSFDLLIEATDALNKQPEKLNEIYERLVTEIRKTNPERIIMISPRLRSDAAYLHELKIPTGHNGYLMAEWHFYAAGPSKTNERKLWTTGTEHERSLIDQKIQLALEWQQETGVPTWVGAWMPGNYNDGNDYTIEEQVEFASYMTQQLTNAGIPFAVNSDTKFYDRETNEWIEEMQPVFDCIYN